ncbi:ricin-type beta-trefoil lectin domain protein [Actinoplanes sp. G11-F43]|uniref:ricin-type beta-trefoil lectin domain protein n=1 Tax=Actinoplanes sp. G11-F43 TaxID=3424130 RepID=UPI003D3284B8
MGEQLGDERDPLLVRPFVLPDGDRQAPAPSTSTWPAQAGAGEVPTQLLPAAPAAPAEPAEPGTSSSRRSLILIGAAVTAVAGVAGYALMRPAPEAEWVSSQPGLSHPAVIGPSLTPSAGEEKSTIDGLTGDGSTVESGGDPGGGTVTRGGTRTPAPGGSGSASRSAGASPSTGGGPTSAAPAPPIDLLPSAIPTGQGLLINGSGLCLDLRGGRASDGRDVHVDDCNGTSPQRWRLNSDRTLEVLDMCAAQARDGSVELTSCDGRFATRWQLFDNGVLINTANGQCLTDPNSGSRPANAVVVTLCAGGRNQSWTFG